MRRNGLRRFADGRIIIKCAGDRDSGSACTQIIGEWTQGRFVIRRHQRNVVFDPALVVCWVCGYPNDINIMRRQLATDLIPE